MFDNIDFNTISYDEGLTLVKEAADQRLIKVAEGGGVMETIKDFISKNPELLKRVGIGAGVGGGLGLLSSLTESPRTRRPIRRGLVGALLGALGGGATHAVLANLPTHELASQEGAIRNYLRDMHNQVGADRFENEVLPQLIAGGTITAEEAARYSPVGVAATPEPVGETLQPSALISPWQYARGALGAGVGQELGARYAQNRMVEGLAADITKARDEAIAKLKSSDTPRRATGQQAAASRIINRRDTPGWEGVAARHSVVPGLLSKNPVSVQKDYRTVLGSTPRSLHTRGRTVGGGLGLAATLSPEIIRFIRRLHQTTAPSAIPIAPLESNINAVRELQQALADQ